MQSGQPVTKSTIRKVAELDPAKKKALFNDLYVKLRDEEKLFLYNEEWKKCKALKEKVIFNVTSDTNNNSILAEFATSLVKLAHYRNHFSDVLTNTIFRRKQAATQVEIFNNLLGQLLVVENDKSDKHASPEFLVDVLNLVELNMHKYHLDVGTATTWVNLKHDMKRRINSLVPEKVKLSNELCVDATRGDSALLTLPEAHHVKMQPLVEAKKLSFQIKRFLADRDKASDYKDDNHQVLVQLSKEEKFIQIQQSTNSFLQLNYAETLKKIKQDASSGTIWPVKHILPMSQASTITSNELAVDKFVMEFRQSIMILLYQYLQHGRDAFEGNPEVDIIDAPSTILELILARYSEINGPIPDEVKAKCNLEELIKHQAAIQKTISRYKLSAEDAIHFMEIKFKLKREFGFGKDVWSTTKFFTIDKPDLSEKIITICQSMGIKEEEIRRLIPAFNDKLTASQLRNLLNTRKNKGMDSNKFVESYHKIMPGK